MAVRQLKIKYHRNLYLVVTLQPDLRKVERYSKLTSHVCWVQILLSTSTTKLPLRLSVRKQKTVILLTLFIYVQILDDYQPNRAMGTLRVDFRKKIHFSLKICCCSFRALFLSNYYKFKMCWMSKICKIQIYKYCLPFFI